MQSTCKYKDGRVDLTQVRFGRVFNSGQTWKSYSLDKKEKCVCDYVYKKSVMHM